MNYNKLKQNKGITLASLIVTLVIMVILASAVIISYNNIVTSTEQKEFASEIYSIQKLVDNYKFMNNKLPVKSEIVPTSKNPLFQGESTTYYELDLYEAGVEQVSRGTKKTANDIYIVTNSGKVYYLEGQEIGKNIYYTLTDDLKKKIGLSV